MPKISPNAPCPCGSGTKLKRCCRPLHRGALAATPEALMRSRYVAYALGEADYVMDTTHPEGPIFQSDREAWRDEVRTFSSSTEFERLEVLGSGEDGDRGWVEFRAHLTQGGADVSFTERSRFDRVEGRWLYHSADVAG